MTMDQYLPVLWFLLAALCMLFIAGLGAAGNLKGALRYMRTWFLHVGALAAAGMVFALMVYGFTPSQ
jgi:hypothetical protein